MKKSILLMFLSLLPILASADKSGSCGKNVTYTFVESTHTLTISGSGAMTYYSSFKSVPWYSYRSEIAKAVIEYGLTSIGSYAFCECSGITSVSIPNSVTSIGDWAFCECSGLTSVSIPNSVATIGSSAFSGCSGLTSVTIPNSVTSIGNGAFWECSGLTSVNIGNSVTSIGDEAFYNCSGLTSVSIGNSVTSIGNFAFCECSGLTSVNIPNSVTSIGYEAFSGCSGLTSVTIGNSVTSIGNGAFTHCSGLTSIVVGNGNTIYDSRDNCNAIIETSTNKLLFGCMNTQIPNSITSIGDGAFYNCSGLTSVTIPNSVTIIDSYAFAGCSGLTSVTIPDGVTSISKHAFSYCSGLTSVTIPNSVTSIGDQAFEGCSGLTSVTIGNSVTSIGYRAFFNCSGLASVSIPGGVSSIGSSAFQGCSGLESVKVSVTDFAAFCNNSVIRFISSNISKPVTLIDKDGNEIKEYVIPNGVTSIGNYAFQNCNNLSSITIPNSVTNIGWDAFWGCTGLETVTIHSSSIGSWLSGLTSIKEVIIGDEVTSIGNSAFNGCTGLTSIAIPNSVTSIGGGAFSGCTGLTSVTIPNSVTSIGGSAFSGCSGLTSVTIPNSVTSIGSSAFSGCSSLTSVNISSLKEWTLLSFPNVESNPLYYAHHLYLNGEEVKDMSIPSDVTTIGARAFVGCTGLESVRIPNNVAEIGSGAFSGCDNLLTVNSEIMEPYNCSQPFSNNTYRKGTLNVPAGTKDLYIRFDGWREFLKIEEVGGAPQVYQLSFVVDNKELLKQETEVGATITPPTEDANGNTISWYTYPTTMPAHDLVVYGMVVKEPEPEVFVWLTIKDGQGTTKMKVKQGLEQVLTIMPEEGWKILSVAMDGTDVTAQVTNGGSFTTPAINSDASIIIVYEQEAPSGVRATQSQTNVKVVSDGVVISNAEPDTRCVIYSMDGQQVVNTVISEGTRKITLQQGQVYILTIDGRTLKFAL